MEFARLIEELENNPEMGTAIVNHCYKIRFAIASKRKGKSGGARIITHYQVIDNSVFLLSIYDKSEQENISENEINYLLSFIR